MNAPVKPLLEIENLKTWFFTRDGVVRAVDGVSFAVYPGETLAVVGESGCGKSVTALSILRLIASPPGRIVSGKLLFEDKDLLAMDEAGMREHRGLGGAAALAGAVNMLRQVDIPEPERRAGEYPHQLSGGMRQRVMIAMALACQPRLLIADEPTTALDVTIQAQILDLMRALKSETGTAIMLITHSLGVIAEMADSVVVMYAGRIVEKADVRTL